MGVLPIESDEDFFETMESINPKVIFFQNSIKNDLPHYRFFYFPHGGLLIVRCTKFNIPNHPRTPKTIKFISNHSKDIEEYDEKEHSYLD